MAKEPEKQQRINEGEIRKQDPGRVDAGYNRQPPAKPANPPPSKDSKK